MSYKGFAGIHAMIALLGGAADVEPAKHSHEAAAQQNPETASEADLISAYPAVISREGAVLTVQGTTFTDEGDCQEGACARYRADGMWKGKNVGVAASFHEGRDYFLVTGGFVEPIGSRPISSPSGNRFFTGHHSDHAWSPYQGASIWDWEPEPRRLRIVDTPLVSFDEFVSWRGDGCVEFRGTRGHPSEGAEVRSFWLAKRMGDWQLLESRPNTCQ